MNLNPLLMQLGFDKNDRVVIIHADDVGMCQATIPAFAELIELGSISSGAVMVPCPWFLQVAAYYRQQPKADVGVHLTLTSEWSTYRWGPLSTHDPASGLIDEGGYFHHRAHQVHEHGSPQAVQTELKAQLTRALNAGIEVTHIDTHMGALAHPKFLPIYIRLGQLYNLPAVIPADGESDWQVLGLDAQTASIAAGYVREYGNDHTLLQIDHFTGLRLDHPQERFAQAKSAFDSLLPGLTHFVIHPAQDTPELRAATPSTWECRVGDYEVFRSEQLLAHIKDLGIKIIGYKPLQQIISNLQVSE
jgi:predicted glycoside hydrolase/deacetylase ChbG (UPF0249 family)